MDTKRKANHEIPFVRHVKLYIPNHSSILNQSHFQFPKMTFYKFIIAILLPLFFIHSHGIIIIVRNNCPYTIWPAVVAGGSQRLDSGQTWSLGYPKEKLVKIWAHTNCTFDSSGRGNFLIGDYGGLLGCKELGAPPATFAEYGLNSWANKDYYDISTELKIEFAILDLTDDDYAELD